MIRPTKAKSVRHWYYAFAQPATYLGIIAIIIILNGAFFLEKEEYNRAYEEESRVEPISLASSKSMSLASSIVRTISFCCSVNYINATQGSRPSAFD